MSARDVLDGLQEVLRDVLPYGWMVLDKPRRLREGTGTWRPPAVAIGGYRADFRTTMSAAALITVPLFFVVGLDSELDDQGDIDEIADWGNDSPVERLVRAEHPAWFEMSCPSFEVADSIDVGGVIVRGGMAILTIHPTP